MLRKDPMQRPKAQQILDFPPVAKYAQEIMEDPRYQDSYLYDGIGGKKGFTQGRTANAMTRVD